MRNELLHHIIFLVTCTICQRLSVVILHMLGDLGLRSVMEIHNFPMPVGPIITPAPWFACLIHGTVGVLLSWYSGRVLWECWTLRWLYPPSPGCLQWFANHTSGCSWFGIWSCGSDWNQELGAALAKAFVFSISPVATRFKLWSYPGCGVEEEEGAHDCF